MNTPEIERSITEAISNRPTVTNAPLNLYIYDSKLICGARIVMPKNAKFVAYVPANCLEQGFNDKEWKLIVQKVNQITNSRHPESDKPKEMPDIKQFKQTRFNERRREQRLYYRRPIYYTSDTDQSPSKAVMFDVASGGIAFTCCADKKHLSAGQDISTSFSVPRFNSDDSLSLVNFDRIGRICRVIKKQNYLHQIAVQFSNKLPFKPGEQGVEPIKTTTDVLVRS